MNNETLASEIIHELKASSKRWFIAFITVLVLWATSIGGFLWYISLPVEVTEDTYSQEADNESENNYVGGDYYSGETDNQENQSTQGN